MRHYRIKNKFRFISFLTVMILVVAFAASTALGYAKVSGIEPKSYIEYEVQPGDTLWEIAKTYGPKDQDVRKTVYDICSLNGISASELTAGTTIRVLSE